MGGLPFDPVAEAQRQWSAHGWEHAAPGMAAVTSLMRAQQIVQAHQGSIEVESSAQHGTTFTVSLPRHG